MAEPVSRSTDGSTQLVLVDTPGIFAPKRRLDRAMVTSAWAGAHDADVVCLLVDAKRGLDEETETIVARLAEVQQRRGCWCSTRWTWLKSRRC
jgi:GTP-binding protein Era